MNEHTDTHLTDYALDELDAAERAKIEAMLRDDPPAAAEVEELRGLATSLRAANVRWDERSEAHAESTSYPRGPRDVRPARLMSQDSMKSQRRGRR